MSEETTKYWLKLLRTNQAVFSLISGFTVMLLIGLVMLSVTWFKQTKIVTQSPAQPIFTETIYTVLPGDSSWGVAEEFLGDGFRYPEIEAANNLVHNQHLEVGQKLIIPQGENSENNILAQETDILPPALTPPQEKTYIVETGDSLWKIAQEQYGDGLLWTKIYQQNRQKLGSNPNLIFPQTEIIIPENLLL